MAWYRQVRAADWATPADVKRSVGSASTLNDGRAVFNIAGNKYRIVVWINYSLSRRLSPRAALSDCKDGSGTEFGLSTRKNGCDFHTPFLLRIVQGQLKRHANKPLLGHPNAFRPILHRFKKLRGQAEIHRFVFAFQLEAHHFAAGKFVVGEIGRRHKVLGFLVRFKRRDSFFS
jgi:hypothetical protein